MKKSVRWLSLLLTLCMMLSLAACGAKTATETVAPAETETEIETEAADYSMRGDEFGNGAVGGNYAVSSFNEVTSQVGMDILAAGGNAIDAAVATIFAVGVCEPHHSGIGGSGLMTIYLADEDKYTTIEYMEAIPMNYDGTYTKAKDNATALINDNGENGYVVLHENEHGVVYEILVLSNL